MTNLIGYGLPFLNYSRTLNQPQHMKTSTQICNELTKIMIGSDQISESVVKMITIIETHTNAVRQECAQIVQAMPQTVTLGCADGIDKAATAQAILNGRQPKPSLVGGLEKNIDRLGGTA